MCCSDWVGVRGGGGTVCDVHIRRVLYQQVCFKKNHCPGKYLGWCLVLVQCFRQSAHDFYHMESFHQLQPKGDYTPSLVLGPFTSNQRYSRTH